MTSHSTVLSAVNLTRIYERGREQVHAVDNVSFEIARAEFVAITGPSGAGKSTLVNLIGCMDVPTSGRLTLAGCEARQLTETERTRLRREQIGFVFQHFGLIPTLTVAENVALPALFAGHNGAAPVNELLDRVGLGHRRDHRPHQLSGGEMQRAAIARALVNGPALILADEPTGNLDAATGESIIALFQKLNREGMTLIVVTHNTVMAGAAQRVIKMKDGRIVN